VLKRFLPPAVGYFLAYRDKEAIELARSNGIENARVFDADAQPLADIFSRKFSVVVLADLLDLVVDPGYILDQVVAALKPYGYVIISVTNDNTIYHRMRVLLGKGINKTPFDAHYHFRHPTFRQWRQFLQKYFEIMECNYWICFDKEQGKAMDFVFLSLARIMPSLFARGSLYLCRKGNS